MANYRASVYDSLHKHYRSVGLSDEYLSVILDVLNESLDGLPAGVSPTDPLSRYLHDHLVDSDYDWFWLGTLVRLSRLFEEDQDIVEKRLNAANSSEVKTIDDYVYLLVRYLAIRDAELKVSPR